MQNEIQTLIQKCKTDYTRFVTASGRGTPEPDSYFGKHLLTLKIVLLSNKARSILKLYVIMEFGVLSLTQTTIQSLSVVIYSKPQVGMHLQEMLHVVIFLKSTV